MTAPVTTRLAEVYRQAADVIREGGLCKHSYNLGIQHCTVGAIRKVTGRIDVGSELLAPLATLGLGEKLVPCDCGCSETYLPAFDVVTRFNDQIETTADDVVALFNRTADALEAEA